jgi:hypothetical protein
MHQQQGGSLHADVQGATARNGTSCVTVPVRPITTCAAASAAALASQLTLSSAVRPAV